jgi:hypothetical protein
MYPKQTMFGLSQTNNVWSFFLARHTVTGVIQLEIFQKFTMMIQVWGKKKKIPNDQLLQPDRAGNIYIFTLPFRASWIENFNENKLADTALTLGHLILLTLHHFFFNSGVT